MPMGGRDPGAVTVAADDLRRLSEAASRLSGLLDTTTLARRAARELWRIVGTDATGVSIREAPGVLVTRGGWRVRTEGVRDGLRIAVGDGAIGAVLATGLPVEVADVASAPAVSERLIEQLVRHEGVHAMLGVPIADRGAVIGVLYAMNRSPGHVGGRARILAVEFAATLGPTLGAALSMGAATRRSALEERRRITRDLLDSLRPSILDISSAIERAGRAGGSQTEAVLGELRLLESQTARAVGWLRDVLAGLEPTAEEGLPAAIGVDVRGLSRLTDLTADFAVLGEPYELTAEQERLLLGVVREGLARVAIRGRASTVLVTLHYRGDGVELLVEDDGPAAHEAEPAADDDAAGLEVLAATARGLGGELAVCVERDGGPTVRCRLPTRMGG